MKYRTKDHPRTTKSRKFKINQLTTNFKITIRILGQCTNRITQIASFECTLAHKTLLYVQHMCENLKGGLLLKDPGLYKKFT